MIRVSDVRIGDRFWMFGSLRPARIGELTEMGPVAYQVTDLGSRVVVAVRLDGMVSTSEKGNVSQQHVSFIDDDPSWLNGPPYAIAEHVFDEYCQERCYLTAESCREAHSKPHHRAG